MEVAGRNVEITLLQSLLKKEAAEFVAVYGRRRVGKTYLIREVFQKQIVFECSGLHQKSLDQQLENFWLTLQETTNKVQASLPPQTWLQAFTQLKVYLNTKKGKTKKVVFLDEIPWFETPRSGFLAALDNFWNQYCSKRKDIILVICGSAASWIIKKVLNSRGGLHNRITTHIQLMPFSLYEVKAFFEMKHIDLILKDIAQLYMCVGGIPFYLKEVKTAKSVPQILDELFFVAQASLQREFNNLYAALFKNNELHEQIVEVLSRKRKGLTRKEIIAQTKFKSGGGLSTLLKELIECGFVQQISPIDQKKEIYRLVDEYSLFYFKFLTNKKAKNSWLQIAKKQSFKIWLGIAFENLCLKHILPIKKALGISGIITNAYTFFQKGDEQNSGAQIDLVLDRSDNCINLFELKFHNTVFEVSKEYTRQLQNKIEIFKRQTKTKKNIFLTFLTPYGVSENKYYLSLAANQLLIDDLFEEM